jgi:uncharacterized protein with GYD domain
MKFLMLGKYSLKGLEGASAERTKKVGALVAKSGGRIESIHALLGAYDLVFIADFPGAPDAMKASIGIAKMTGIAFETMPAVPVDEFDRLLK